MKHNQLEDMLNALSTYNYYIGILTRREMMILRHRIAEIDPEAFINVIDSKEILGRGFKPLKES